MVEEGRDDKWFVVEGRDDGGLWWRRVVGREEARAEDEAVNISHAGIFSRTSGGQSSHPSFSFCRYFSEKHKVYNTLTPVHKGACRVYTPICITGHIRRLVSMHTKD